MGLGQTMVTMVAFAVLMAMFVNAYRVLTDADKQILTAEAYKTASDIAQNLMTEILTKKYDANFSPPGGPGYYSGSGAILNSFTAYSSLGPESSRPQEIFSLPDSSSTGAYKSIYNYDDVDDYNRYSRITEATNGLGKFRDSVSVYYVQMTNPPTKYSGNWWTKRVEVWVTNDTWLQSKWVGIYSIVGCSTR